MPKKRAVDLDWKPEWTGYPEWEDFDAGYLAGAIPNQQPVQLQVWPFQVTEELFNPDNQSVCMGEPPGPYGGYVHLRASARSNDSNKFKIREFEFTIVANVAGVGDIRLSSIWPAQQSDALIKLTQSNIKTEGGETGLKHGPLSAKLSSSTSRQKSMMGEISKINYRIEQSAPGLTRYVTWWCRHDDFGVEIEGLHNSGIQLTSDAPIDVELTGHVKVKCEVDGLLFWTKSREISAMHESMLRFQ